MKVCCERLKMEVNKDKTKVMVFRERERELFMCCESHGLYQEET